MPKHGKKYREVISKFDVSAQYAIEEAVSLALQSAIAKFDETVDVAMCLGVNPKYSDQMVRGAVTLPHGLGKTVRIAAFCKGEKETEAKEAGADVFGGDELVERIKGGWLDFDKAVATPDMMAKVGQIGKILGPRGLMPNAKTGTVTFDLASAIRELKAGRVEFKVDKAGVLHAPLGKVSFGAEKIIDNLKVLIETVNRLKPSSAKGAYMKTMTMATTMGPGVKIDTGTLKKFLEG